MKNNRCTFSLSLLAVSIFTATAAYAADNGSPFATPLHLSNPGGEGTVTLTKKQGMTEGYIWETKTTNTNTQGGSTPNIVLYLDDSGSMDDPLTDFSRDSRAEVMKSVLNELFAKRDNQGNYKYADKAKWGVSWMGEINDVGAGNRGVTLTNSHRAIINNIDNGKMDGGTPFLTGYVNAVNQFSSKANELQCQNNYIIAMTDGSANSDSYEQMSKNGYNSIGLNPLLKSSSIWNMAGVSEYKPLTVGNKTFQPYLFGEDRGYLNVENIYSSYIDHWARSNYGLSTNQIDYLDSIFLKQLSEPLEKNAGIKTYTVAFGLGTSRNDTRTKKMLKAGASGGGQLPNGEETYFEANDKDKLYEAFEKMFDSMTDSSRDPQDGDERTETEEGTSSTLPTTPTGPSSTTVTVNQHALAAPAITGEDKLFAGETASIWLPVGDEKGLRSAELRFYQMEYTQNVNNVTTGVKENLGYKTPAFGSRVALISDGRKVSTMDSDFGYNGNVHFGLKPSVLPDEHLNALLPWMSRSKSDSAIRALGYTENTIYRNRNGYQMGDILESDVVSIGEVKHGNGGDFAGRKEFIVAAANDGMAYIFQSNPAANTAGADNPYQLKMTYAPSELVRQNSDDTLAKHYKDIAHQDYAVSVERPHLYMLSGGLVAHTLKKPFKIDYMVANAGRGAKGLYAMNLSAINGGNWKNTVPMFNAGAHKSAESGMGYTIGYPSSARFGKTVLQSDGSLNLNTGIHILSAVGSGFSSKTDLSKQETALYLYDTLGGADVGIEGCGYDKNTMSNNTKNSTDCLPNNPQRNAFIKKVSLGNTGGLATPALLDVNLDGVVDYAFAGDYSGNMYRCDVRDYEKTYCTQIFKGNKNRPITSAPIVSRASNGWEYVVMWGTGSDMFDEDLTENKRQALYGVYQTFAADTLDIVNNKQVGEGSLLKQTFSVKSGKGWQGDTYDKIYRSVSNNSITNDKGERQYDGWMVELDTNGERVVVQPQVVLQTVYFTTRIYDDNSAAAATQKFVPWNNAWTKPEDWEKNGWEKVSSNISSTRNQMCSSDKEDKKAGKNGWRFMGQIDHKDGTPETSYSGTCNNTATTVKTDVDTYKSTCDYEVSEEMTLQSKVAPGITKTSSSLIQLSVLNGGAIFPKKKNTSYMLMDYDENNADGSGYLGNDGITASESYEGLISMTIADPTRRGINSDKHGNVYSRGEYTDLNANPIKRRVDVFDSDNPCRPSVTGHQADAHISNTVSGPDYKQINGTTASINCLRRISWREIY